MHWLSWMAFTPAVEARSDCRAPLALAMTTYNMGQPKSKETARNQSHKIQVVIARSASDAAIWDLCNAWRLRDRPRFVFHT